ncbi:MAG: 4'-phosphopantetheinyl transferase superfamily protein [Desulfobacterales bacterium]|nr:4'-phosphopantetheinyl transferase superfamily protein [Desulfobacterales bacterium]
MIKNDEIHLWLSYPNEIQDLFLLKNYEKLMTEEERIQHKKFHFPKHRHQYLVSRALMRTILSQYTNIKPEDLSFIKNKYGKPEISQDIRFNLSHTDDLIALGIVLKQDIGVDVENINRQGNFLEISDRFFSKIEVQNLNNLPLEKRLIRFFDYWTLKESYIKAKGMGLSIPLEQFSFHISENMTIQISFDKILTDNPSNWKFWLMSPSQIHKLAVAIYNLSNINYNIISKKVVPLI